MSDNSLSYHLIWPEEHMIIVGSLSSASACAAPWWAALGWLVFVSRITQTVSECEENILYFVVSCKCCFDPWSTLNWFQMINFARSSQWVQKQFFFSSSFMTITFKSQLPKYIIIWCVNKLLHNVSPYERILTASLGSGKAFIY